MTDLNGQLMIRTSGASDELSQLLKWFRADEALQEWVIIPAPQILGGQVAITRTSSSSRSAQEGSDRLVEQSSR